MESCRSVTPSRPWISRSGFFSVDKKLEHPASLQVPKTTVKVLDTVWRDLQPLNTHFVLTVEEAGSKLSAQGWISSERLIYGQDFKIKMEIEWFKQESENEAQYFFRNFAAEKRLTLFHGNMKHRSATEIWNWLTFLVKKINGFIKYFKCDGVNIINAWQPLRPGGFKNMEQRRRTRKRGLDSKDTEMHQLSDLKSEDSTPDLSGKADSRSPLQQSQSGWVKRLIIRGVNRKLRANKLGIESEGETRRMKLARKRRRVTLGWVKHQSEPRESGLRAFLRPEECGESAGQSSPNAKLESTTNSPRDLEAFLIDYSLESCSPEGKKLSSEYNTPIDLETFLIDYSADEQLSENKNEEILEDGKEEEPCHYRNHSHARRKASPPDERLTQFLPDELVDKILKWLPLTSLLLARSVCRRWQSNMSSEGWRKIFPQPPAWPACPAVFTSGNGRRQCAFYDLSLHKWSRIFLDFLPEPACHLLAASGGLLCLCYSGMNSSLYVCNPLTKSWRALPSFNHTRRRAGSMLVHMLVHPKTKAYKVILIGHPTCMTSAPPTMMEVFDSETGSWTSLANVPSDGCTLASSVILRKGILYCLTELPTGLLAFNLARKVWRRLEIKSHFRVLFIFEHHGHILLVARMTARITRLGIWRLRESFPRVWLKVAIMPADHANYFIKSGRLQCFGHGNFICFASPRGAQWLLFDLGKRLWTWGSPADWLDQDSYNRWFFYEPRLDIQA